MQSTITLQANVPKRVEALARNLVLLDIGVAPTIDIAVSIKGFAAEELRGVKRGLNMRTQGFTDIVLTSPVATTVQLIATVADIDVNYLEGATVNANILGTVPVSPDRGAADKPIYAVGITYADAPAVGSTNNAPFPVVPAGVGLLAANANRREARFLCTGPDPVCIAAPAGIAWSKRVIVLDVGDVWVETRGANLAWSAICDAGKSSSVNVQEVLS